MASSRTQTIERVAYSNEQIVNAATDRWGEVAQEVKPASPYPIQVPEGPTIVIMPLTRRRRKALKAAQAAYLMVGAQLAEAQNTAEERDGDGNVTKAATSQATIDRISRLLDDAEYAYDKALFGDVVDEVIELFDDLDEAYWDAMYLDVHAALVNRVELPEDVCSKCGQKVGEEADGEGKDESSST